MCATCGCSGTTEADVHAHGHDHGHDHGHEHGDAHSHHHEDGKSVLLRLEERVLARNAEQAVRNRRWLSERQILAVNLMSSPGAGKTTLLERLIREIAIPIQVIEGDQETDNDARRLRDAGCRAVQINTGTGCHLDAQMVERGIQELSPAPRSVVVIENVGNLVCPALFDLGEHERVVVSAVTEGDDKPIKYPHMFKAATLLLLNKVDLLPHVPFDTDRFLAYARQVNPRLRVLGVSALRGDGLAEWYGWLREQARHAAA
jgi:hydrogenase nickel incorporation protein HypB